MRQNGLLGLVSNFKSFLKIFVSKIIKILEPYKIKQKIDYIANFFGTIDYKCHMCVDRLRQIDHVREFL